MFFMVQVFASNNHTDLELEINAWLRYKRLSKILKLEMVADGAEYTYCVLILYVPRGQAAAK